jgi:multidrug efflux pump subunit AcrA (membrane-fusion protein)
VKTSKLLQRILLAGCLLPTAFCLLIFGQGGTGKLPPRRNPPPPIRRPTPDPRVTPPISYLKSTVIASGEVRPNRYVKITSEVSGRLQEIYVEPGQEITKGQRLLLIDSGTTGPRSVIQYSPLKGIVADISTRTGETMVSGLSGPTLMTIADMSKIYVEVAVDETDFSKIAVGQSARIRVDAFPENEIRGSVTAKNPLPTVPPYARGGTALKAFGVTIELRDIPVQIRSRLRPGMSATATITVVIRKYNH